MLEKNSFFDGVKKIFLGSSLERLILVIFTPILTRLYSPQDFALFAIFSSAIAVFARIRCLNYQVLIVTREDHEINDLINDSFKISIILFILYLIVFYIFNFFDLVLFKKIKNYIILICVTIFISNNIAIFHTIFIRFEEYTKLNLIRIVNVFIFSLAAIYFSYFNFLNYNGLIISYFLGFVASIIFCFFSFKKILKILNYKIDGIHKKIKKEKDLTLYLSAGHFVSTISNELPIFVLIMYYGDIILSFFSLVLRVVSVPVTIFSKSFGTINFRHITIKIKNNEPIFKYLLKLIFSLISITIPPILICYFYAENIFGFIFGEQWSRAGLILNIMSIAISLKFVGLTVFESIYPLKIVKRISFWQYTLTIFIIILAISGKNLTSDEFFYCLAAIEGSMYLILSGYILHKSYEHDQKKFKI